MLSSHKTVTFSARVFLCKRVRKRRRINKAEAIRQRQFLGVSEEIRRSATRIGGSRRKPLTRRVRTAKLFLTLVGNRTVRSVPPPRLWMGMVLWLCTARTGRNLVASLIRAAQWSETDHPLPPRRHEAVAPPRGLTAALVGLG